MVHDAEEMTRWRDGRPMEAAYLRAGLEDLLGSPYPMIVNAVQAILNHTWTPA